MSTDNDTSSNKLPDFLRTGDQPKPSAEAEPESQAKSFTTGKEPLSAEYLEADHRLNQLERERLLDDASAAMNSRQPSYGPPAENFDRIAALWEVVFGHGITVEQVALCMDLVKTARLINQPGNRDFWVDKIGYSALGGELATSK